MTPFVRVNSQFEPASVRRVVAENAMRTVVVAPSGRIPPSGTWMVWSLTVGVTADPSTVRLRIRSRPRRAAAVFSSSRSIGPPETFVTVMVETAEMAPRP